MGAGDKRSPQLAAPAHKYHAQVQATASTAQTLRDLNQGLVIQPWIAGGLLQNLFMVWATSTDHEQKIQRQCLVKTSPKEMPHTEYRATENRLPTRNLHRIIVHREVFQKIIRAHSTLIPPSLEDKGVLLSNETFNKATSTS